MLSAEDTSTLSKALLEDIYGLIVPSVPDGMILDDSVTYQQAVTSQQAQGGNKYICPHVLIEVKHFDTNSSEYVFTGKEAPKVIKKLKNKLDIENIIKYFSECNLPLPTKNGWTLKQLSKSGNPDGASPLEIRDSSGALVATLHQLDTYLLECYLYDEIKGVIWTNGLCWKIWKKNALGTVRPFPNLILDRDQRGYVEHVRYRIGDKYYAVPIDVSGKPLKAIDIDPDYFAEFRRKLKYHLSTL